MPYRRLLCWIVALGWVSAVAAQPAVTYEIAFPNAAHHEAEVVATFTGVPAGTPLAVRMSRTSPGRYALHEFSKNVYGVRVTDGAGQPLGYTRPNLHQWTVAAGHDGTVRFAYTLFADRADGTYSGIDRTHAHLNMPATFVWAPALADAPATVRFVRPDPSWRVATQLFPTDDAETFTAPNVAYLMDSPTEVSPFSLRTWTVPAGEGTATIRLAVHHDGTEADVDAYAEMAQQVVAEQLALFGGPPAYETGTYTFIACYLPHVSGDGMEHRNSTILTSTRSLEESALGLLGTLSHEFFHQWNVERLRPQTLEPFDFTDANVSGALWFAEGFTSYYDDLFIRRAGLYDDARYARGLGGGLSYVLNSPARRFFSPVEMSMQAPFVDAATSVDPTNRGNTFISYYTWGSVLGLGLDLTLRSTYDLTLDDYLRTLWQRYGAAEQPYTLADLQQTLADVTGDAAFAEAFFTRYVYDSEVMDYEALLAEAGFLLRPARPEAVWLGSRLTDGEAGPTVASYTTIGSPLYDADLDRGAVLTALGGEAVASVADVEAILEAHAPGDVLDVAYTVRGQAYEAALTLAADPQVEVVPYEDAGRTLTEAQQAFRAAWLGSLTD